MTGLSPCHLARRLHGTHTLQVTLYTWWTPVCSGLSMQCRPFVRPMGLQSSPRHPLGFEVWRCRAARDTEPTVDPYSPVGHLACSYALSRSLSPSPSLSGLLQISVCPRRTVGVRAAGAGCVQQAGACDVSGGPELPGGQFAQKTVPRRPSSCSSAVTSNSFVAPTAQIAIPSRPSNWTCRCATLFHGQVGAGRSTVACS